MAGRCAVVGCDLTADAAWVVVNEPDEGRLVEVPICGLHFPDLASGTNWKFDPDSMLITITEP